MAEPTFCFKRANICIYFFSNLDFIFDFSQMVKLSHGLRGNILIATKEDFFFFTFSRGQLPPQAPIGSATAIKLRSTVAFFFSIFNFYSLYHLKIWESNKWRYVLKLHLILEITISIFNNVIWGFNHMLVLTL